MDVVVPVTVASVIVSARRSFWVVTPVTCIVVDPVVFPETVIVSADPVAKSTSMLMVPPPVRLPVNASGSSTAPS